MEQPASGVGVQFEQLVGLMARLRAPGGCPWDREQTFDTIKPFTLEETYEVFDAIDRRDWPSLAEELGDYMLQAVFYAEMAREAGHFSIGDSLDAINRKLIRRHPHVFAEDDVLSPGDVKRQWDEIKKSEKSADSLLGGVPRAQPALAEAQQLSSKAAAVGFDWPGTAQVLDKLREELAELDRAGTPTEQAGELGDILFVVVNLARKMNIDAEQALRQTNAKFRSRFGYVEQRLNASGKTWAQTNLEEMDGLWNEAKSTSAS